MYSNMHGFTAYCPTCLLQKFRLAKSLDGIRDVVNMIGLLKGPCVVCEREKAGQQHEGFPPNTRGLFKHWCAN